MADVTPPELRGAAFGLRQSLDTIGAFLGPLLAVGLMLLWQDDFRAIFWVAVIPGLMAVALLFLGLHEPRTAVEHKRTNPVSRANLKRLGKSTWWVIALGGIFTLARFSEAFLVLRAQEVHIPLALIPLVMVAMNLLYSFSAYPFGKLADRMSHSHLLQLGLVVLVAADIVLALSAHWVGVLVGVALLLASTGAGLLWTVWGSESTFIAGAVICLITLLYLRVIPAGLKQADAPSAMP